MTWTRGLLIGVWGVLTGATGGLAQSHIWAAVFPLTIFLLATVILWVGNILADRIEDHDHRRR